MAKVHPLSTSNSDDVSSTSTSCSNNKYTTSKRETFTIWMKSLVMQGNGCTAFDENGEIVCTKKKNGEIVYRIDNYDDKHSHEVYLMDLRGKLLFTVCEKKICVFPSWKGYRNANKPLFQVRKSWGSILGKNRGSVYKVTMRSDSTCYRLEGLTGKSSEFRITDNNGEVVTEARRKQSSSGVALGDDVFTLVVEPHVDHSFIMALVTVYGLIKRQI